MRQRLDGSVLLFGTLCALVLVACLWFGGHPALSPVAVEAGARRDTAAQVHASDLSRSASAEAARETAGSSSRVLLGGTATKAIGSLRISTVAEVNGDLRPIPFVPILVVPASADNRDLDALRIRSGADGVAVLDQVPIGKSRVCGDANIAAMTEVVVSVEETCNVNLVVKHFQRITGTVRDEDGGPVAFASVEMQAWGGEQDPVEAARCDAMGRFWIGCAPPMVWLRGRHERYAMSEVVEIEGVAGVDYESDIILRHAAGGIRGCIRGPDANPVAGAAVWACERRASSKTRVGDDEAGPGDAEVGIVVRTTSDPFGRFSIEGLAEGRVEVWAQAKGLGPSQDRVDVRAGMVAETEIRLPRGASVSGVVKTHAGEVCEGCRVYVEGLPNILRVETIAEDSGRYVLGGIPAGGVILVASKSGGRFAREKERITVTHGQVMEWNPVLYQSGEIRGQIVSTLGRPLGGLHLWVMEAARNSRYQETWHIKTDSTGHFRSTGHAGHGSVRVYIVKGLEDPLLAGEWGANEQSCMAVVPDPGSADGVIVGEVECDDAALMQRTRAYVRRNRGKVSEPIAATSPALPSGSFRWSGLMKGEYTVEIVGPGCPAVVRTVSVVDGNESTIGRVRLRKGGWINVRVDGQLEGRAAYVRVLDSSGVPVCTVDLRGRVHRSTVLPEGMFFAQLGGAQIASATVAVTVREGMGTDAALAAVSGVPCEFRVVSEGESGSPGDLRLVVRRGGDVVAQEKFAEQLGSIRWTVLNLAGGKYDVEAWARGERVATKELVVDPSGANACSLTLPAR